MLAPDGRCKTLDAAADGYVRAENCIVMVLESLDDGAAQCPTLLRGSAVNQARRMQYSYSYINNPAAKRAIPLTTLVLFW